MSARACGCDHEAGWTCEEHRLTPTKPFLRRGVIMEAVDATVQGMGEMGMNPPEALTAAELVLWTFIENGLKLSPSPEILLKTKEQAARVVARIASRIEAWPAKTYERN